MIWLEINEFKNFHKNLQSKLSNFVPSLFSSKMMHMKILYLICFGLLGLIIRAQDPHFKVEVSSDTILLGNYFELKYTIENTQGDFAPPEFNGLKLVAGPNHASSYSIMNGKVKQSTSYIYFLKPEAEGQYIIEAAQLKTEEGILKTPFVKIHVVANPNGVRQNPGRSMEFEDPDVQIMTPKDAKKKKKVYKL